MPARLRRKHGLRAGTRLVFVDAGHEIQILKEQDLSRSFAVFDGIRKDTKVTREVLEALVNRAKSRLWKERYANRR